MFVMRVATLASELQEHAPGLAIAMRRFREARRRGTCADLSANSNSTRSIAWSRRRASTCSACARASDGIDVGSWEGLWEALREGADRNAMLGNVIALDTDGVMARGGKRLMVLVGVSDLVAVDTGDAILIARRSQSQEVRRVPEELARRGLSRYL